MGCSVGAGVGGATHMAARTAAASVTATSSAAAGAHSIPAGRTEPDAPPCSVLFSNTDLHYVYVPRKSN